MPSLFTELRRRNVFKVGAAYAIVAWLLIEVSSVLLPTFNAPEWIMQVFTLFVILGFPLALILAWAFDVTPQGIKAASDVRVGDAPTQPTRFRFGYISQGLILLAVGFLVVDQYVLEPQAGTSTRTSPVANVSFQPVRRMSTNLGPTQSFRGSALNAFIALSRDGRRIAYTVQVDGALQLYLRELDQLTARAIPGTDGAINPFFSPNGEWVAFNIGGPSGGVGDLTKVSVRGGPTQTLGGEMRPGVGGFWATDGTIIFTAPTPEGVNRLHRISAAGGVPELLDGLSEVPGFTHSWPHVLPGGDHMLFTVRPIIGTENVGYIAVLSLETGESWTLIEGAYNARYTPTGHIVFMKSNSLWAVPFDLERLEKIGPEIPVVNGVQTASDRGGTPYAFSDDGLLAYLPGIDVARRDDFLNLVWVDREGREEILDFEPRDYAHPRLSPDGERVAVTLSDSTGNEDIWIYELTRGTTIRLTSSPGTEDRPLWTPDGQRVAYSAERGESDSGIYWKRADGVGQEERLTTGNGINRPVSFSPDGNHLVFWSQGGRLDILSLKAEQTSQPVFQSDVPSIAGAMISPDGRWLAHDSSESGVREIYVQPFPNVDGGKWPISTAGGYDPRWGAEGRELFYMVGDSMMAVSVGGGSTFLPGRPEVLFTGDYGPNFGTPRYDFSPDGQRFLMRKSAIQTQGVSGSTELVFVHNWFEELNRLAPPSP